jgi:SAM-dependent methyltransferase
MMPTDQSYNHHWNEKFCARTWGRYPPEDLVRFMGRNFKTAPRQDISVLEVGCGPGANIWFLHREGYKVAGIDGSSAAIEKATRRIESENANLGAMKPDLKMGNFSTLPWDDEVFDVVIDIFSIYANTVEVIEKTLSEIHRVLKPGGRFYSKLWGTKTTGFGQGIEMESGTFDEIPCGPCFDMGVSHFFDEQEIQQKFGNFQIDAIDTILRSDSVIDSEIEEIICQFTKKMNV